MYATPEDPSLLPTYFVAYKYVMYSWKNSPTLKKDPLARTFFQSLSTPHGLLTLLGAPLTLYESSTSPAKAPELYLSDKQGELLKSHLAITMGPTRAAASWKADANVPRAKLLGGIKKWHFASPAQVESKLLEMQRADNSMATVDTAKDLEAMRRVYEGAMEGSQAAFLALDVETWEHDHFLLTEFGWSQVVFGSEATTEREDRHVVVQENAHRRNGRYCPDARDHFDFGTTTTLPSSSLLTTLQTLFKTLSSRAPLFLIMHDPRSDLTALELLGIDTSSFTRDVLSFRRAPLPTKGIFVLDTQKLYAGWMREKKQMKLGTCCEVLEVQTRRLHNAGNDARYTLDVFERLMERGRVPPKGGSAGR